MSRIGLLFSWPCTFRTNNGYKLSVFFNSTKPSKICYLKKTRTSYYHQGIQIWWTTFLFLHGIGKRRLDNVQVSYENFRLISRTHGNCNCRPHNGFTAHELIHTIMYIKNYAETNRIHLPGWIPGYKRTDIQLLLTHTTKWSIWREYIKASGSLDIRTVR